MVRVAPSRLWPQQDRLMMGVVPRGVDVYPELASQFLLKIYPLMMIRKKDETAVQCALMITWRLISLDDEFREKFSCAQPGYSRKH